MSRRQKDPLRHYRRKPQRWKPRPEGSPLRGVALPLPQKTGDRSHGASPFTARPIRHYNGSTLFRVRYSNCSVDVWIKLHWIDSEGFPKHIGGQQYAFLPDQTKRVRAAIAQDRNNRLEAKALG